MNQAYQIFDRLRVRRHRDRAANASSDYTFLLREMAQRLADRLPDIKRSFPVALDLGAHNGLLAEYVKGAGGIETLVQADLSEQMIRSIPSPLGGGLGWGRAEAPSAQCPPPNLPPNGGGVYKLVADEELLPFAPQSFDLVMSAGSLHWVNDVPGTLIQIHRILKPGGLFLAILPGGETLKELRQSFEKTEIESSGGLSPRISPFIDVKDAGSLLQRAGFAEPVTDSEILTVAYADPLKLLHDLRGMGETNAMLASSKRFTKRSLILSALDYYRDHFSDAHKRVSATFEFVTLTAWKSDGVR